MVTPEKSKLYTMAEFIELALKAENADKHFELINGEIIEMSPGRTRNSWFANLIIAAVHRFCDDHNLPYSTSNGDSAFDIQGNTVAPDFAFKRTPMGNEYPDPIAPEWAVEIISPTDKGPDIRAKRQIYLRAGILYWEMYPESQSIDVYAPGQPLRTFNIDDTLDGSDVLPGFTLPVKNIFAR